MQLALLKAEFQEKATLYTDAHPEMVRLKRQMAVLEKIAAQTTQFESGLEALVGQRAAIQKNLEGATQRASQARLGESLERAQFSERLEVLEQAVLPQKPTKPNRPKLLGVAFALALLAGFGAVAAMEILNRTIWTDARSLRCRRCLPGGPDPVYRDQEGTDPEAGQGGPVDRHLRRRRVRRGTFDAFPGEAARSVVEFLPRAATWIMRLGELERTVGDRSCNGQDGYSAALACSPLRMQGRRMARERFGQDRRRFLVRWTTHAVFRSGCRSGPSRSTRRILESRRIISYDVADQRSKSFDMLRTQILQSMHQNKWQVLAITSPTAGCGKTLTAINLALSVARQPECSALLVDMDLQKPQVARRLGIPMRDGPARSP